MFLMLIFFFSVFRATVLAQVLVVAAQSRDLSAQQHAFNRLATLPAVSLHPHLRAARNAALRRRVSALIRRCGSIVVKN